LLICDPPNEELGTVFEKEMGPLKVVRILWWKNGLVLGPTLMTIGGRAAVTDIAKRAPLSAAAAIEATPKDFMMADE
jgi:hypothetical protein